MPAVVAQDAIVLLLDTCGERASLAMSRGASLLAGVELEERTASNSLLRAIRELLRRHQMNLSDLAGIGVVSGPGSFTGIRIGLAMAKGLCEAAHLPVAGVSRLAVLAEAAGLRQGFALLSAGRSQVYVHERGLAPIAREFMADLAEVEVLVKNCKVAVTSPELAAQLGATASISLVSLTASHAIAAVRTCFATGGSDLATLDANYVRDEAAIYPRATQPSEQVLAR